MYNWHRQRGASWTEHFGWQVPACFAGAEDEVGSVRRAAGLADLSWVLKFDLKGQGAKDLPPLNQGLFSWPLAPLHFLVTCNPSARSPLMEALQELQGAGSDLSLPPPLYITDVTSVYAQFLLAGPRCREILGKLTSLNLSDRALPDLSCGQSSVSHVHAIILRNDLEGFPAYHLLISREYGESIWESVLEAGEEFDLVPLGLQAQQLLGV